VPAKDQDRRSRRPAGRAVVLWDSFCEASSRRFARDVSSAMPRKPNYNFEKRQKELARQQKRDTKRQERRDRKQGEHSPENDEPQPDPAAPPEERPAEL
jgi:hypothetical protein